MTGYYDHLDFNAPLSSARADALAAALARRRPRRLLDVGCGWGELLLRTLAAAPDAHGTGWDVDERLLERGRANAAQRGLADRVEFVSADPGGEADLVVCIGSEQVYGSQREAIAAVQDRVAPGGVVLFGTAYWRSPPSSGQATALGASPEDLGTLAEVVEGAVAGRLRLLDLQTATEDEWNAFESGFLADWEQWLHDHPDDPEAARLRESADARRRAWLAGYRDVVGWTYLTLGRTH